MSSVWTKERINGFLNRFNVYFLTVPTQEDKLDIMITYEQLQQMFEEVESNSDAWAGALEEAIDEMAGPASDSIMERAAEIFENGI